MAYLDLRELAAELEALRERRTAEEEHLLEEHGVNIDAVDLGKDGQGDVPTSEDYHTSLHEDGVHGHSHEDIVHWVEWLDEDDAERLKVLEDLDGELGGNLDDWARNEPTAIPDEDFEEYAEELANDLGAINTEATSGWPLNCIDWKEAAEQLQVDYTSFDFEGRTYWVRSY